MLDSREQSWNAEHPISVTEFGILIDSIPAKYGLSLR